MPFLLKFAALVDRVSELFGKLVIWLVLASVLISAANAVVRKALNYSSNAYLEIQWYLFAAVFMLGGGFVLLKNGHVRIDFIASRLSARANAIVDLLGLLLLVVPFSILMIDLSWPLFHQAWVSGEMSQNVGGLIRWPVLVLIPLGFALLALQALAELIKRVAFLTGHRSSPMSVEPHEKSEQERLLEELQAEAEAHAARPAGDETVR
ncbi:MAG TPA: TRAP transporter small permease subunit [Rubrivivax sp.]|nr:TRAP transporter small permease subunit [Rubrivivax sp.]HMR70096.1 TRAP transporter small permease subunit [Rubrivivax sp.]